MDPVSAIGLVSGILSFVGAAEKTLKLSWAIYNSLEGSSEETEMRVKLTDNMAVIWKRIISTNQFAQTEEDRALVTLAQECNELTNDIQKELKSLKPKRRKSKTQSGLSALKILMIEPKIKDLEKRLQHCRDQLHFHITTLSGENVKALLATCKEDGAKLTQLERSITQLRQTLQDMTTTKAGTISDQALDQLQNLLHIGQDALNEVAQDRILRGIKGGFEDMSYRYQSVESSYRETFEWIFDLDEKSSEAAKLTQWLSSGDDIFHICGKLGAGKSTLMKKLFTHKRTRIGLKKWAQGKGGRKLIMANFFFYALGPDPRQKSLMGLYRTLLYQILTKSPGLIQHLLPDQWTKALSQPKIRSAYDILDDDIKQAFERLPRQQDSDSLGGYCFRFFIDGLDEYQATRAVDRREMIRSLTNLANSASGCFKLCVSSRIENPFMDMFSEDSRLYLHELTGSDMDEYVQGNLEYVGTVEERRQLASSITKKAEGVFLWVVLVVQNIRKLSDDGARFSRLLSEIESLPTELNELFQRILDTLGTEDRRLMCYTVSLLRFLAGIPEAKKMHLSLTLSDFYFLVDYESDLRFAESAQFPKLGSETVRESELRARRQLRGVCRGLVEADKENDIDFTHRSVGDFFEQEKIQIEMHDGSFNNMEALSQLKLASIKQYWWDREQQNGQKDHDSMVREEGILNRHSILVACLVELRRGQQLDAPPFGFLTSLDTIPMLSASATISHSLACYKTAFRINLAQKIYEDSLPYTSYEICHTSRVRHTQSDLYTEDRNDEWPTRDNFKPENSEVLWRIVDEDVDKIEEYTRAVISPLLTELCSGRLEYPRWRIAHIHDMPLEPDNLAMLVYCAIGAGIGRDFWPRRPFTSAEDDDDKESDGDGGEDPGALMLTGLRFLQLLFEDQIVSPNSPTHLAFGGEFGFIRIAAENQRLSIWQHFLCWWVTVAAASGEYDLEKDTGPDNESSSGDESSSENESSSFGEWEIDPREQMAVNLMLGTFISNGADLEVAFKIADRSEVPTGADDSWVQYTLEMALDGGEALELHVVVNLKFRKKLRGYPYEPPKRWYERNWCGRKTPLPLPDSFLSVRDLIERSRLPYKDVLLKLIDYRLRIANLDNVPISGPRQDELN